MHRELLRVVLGCGLIAAPVISQERAEDPQRPGNGGVTEEVARSTIEIPSDHEGRQVLPLRLLDALRLGRTNNVSLRAEALTPMALSQDLRIREAFFEPELFTSASFTDSTTPQRNSFQPSVARETWTGDLGFRQRLATGGLYELTMTPLRLRQSADVPASLSFPERQYSISYSARVTQPLLRGGWGASNLAEVRRSEAALSAGEARYERTVQDTLISIVRAYWELVFAREDYRVTFEALELSREQLRITNERIRVKQLAERDRVFDEADVARRREELIRAENAIRAREDDLRQLLFDDTDGDLWDRNLQPTSPIEGDYTFPTGDWRAKAKAALRLRPDLAALRADVRQAEIAFERAWRDVLPQLDLVGSYSSEAVDEGFDGAWNDVNSLRFPTWSVGLEFSLPIGNNAARGARDGAMLDLEQARRRLYAAELDVTREVRQALRDLATLAESIVAAEESVRLADTQLSTERERLRVGRGTIFEVQQRNQERLDARQRLLRNQLDYRVSESQLRYVVGVLEVDGGSSAEGPSAGTAGSGSGD